MSVETARAFGPSGVERRAEPRTPTNIPARLFYGAKYEGWIDCVIKDRSAKGAKIQAPAVFQLSRKLVLLDYRAGEAFLAQPRWRKNDLAGLWLEVRHDLRELQDPSLEPVRQAWLALAPGLVSAPDGGEG
ncbi:PilZ domain-containing protein [Phenylobacterium soli]|uniref:PilZ domain-containing protein n=1 Tax=Phenylobacterium soli TaxID=2170551 RepID=UPI001057FAC4|nr:PilZ domain-containing protein [Phenylobacterium soli]